MDTKVCTKCGEDKPLEDFYRDARGRGGRQARCRTCHNSVVKLSPSRANLPEYRRKGREPKKNAARRRVQRAVHAGRLTKPAACESCGNTDRDLHGHHDDYDRPLDVRWLCPPCHGQEHRV